MALSKIHGHDNSALVQESAEVLRKVFPRGRRVAVDVVHVTKSGAGRVSRVYGLDDSTGTPEVWNVSSHVARVLGLKYDEDRRGVYLHGVGMNMALHLTRELSDALYSDPHALGYSQP